MGRGLDVTLEVLSATKNEAAVGVLVAALSCPLRAIREGALRALLERRSPAGFRELVRRWDSLDEDQKSIVAGRGALMSEVVQEAIAGSDRAMCVHGCDAAVWIRQYDLMPALINTTEDKTNPHAHLAAQTLLNLAELLSEELASGRDYQNLRDPELMRRHVVSSLALSVGRFKQHKRTEVIDAFLLLANRDNSTLRTVLQDPHAASHSTVIDTLSESQRPGVMRLLLSYLSDPQAPSAALSVLARRRDMPFLRRLFQQIGREPSANIKNNLNRLEAICWVWEDTSALLELSDAEQHAAVQMAMASAANRWQAFEVLQLLLQSGSVGGRRAAAAALAEFSGSTADELVLRCLHDSDPQVQAAGVRQLRERGIPNALKLLIERLDSPLPEVRQAARACLSEFTCRRYLAVFDTLSADVRRSTGALVRKVDPSATQVLAQELAAASRARRLRALDAASAINAVGELADEIIGFLSDQDHIVRAEAARALRQCDTPKTRKALRQALLDRSVIVQEAAEETLQAFAESAAPLPAEVPPMVDGWESDPWTKDVPMDQGEGGT